MNFKDEYILEKWADKPRYDVIVSIESDPHDQLFISIGTRGEIELGSATLGNLDNDAVDGIIALLERARLELNK